jgi:2-hydroxy-6-oxonona-2,4-dienedioate hydrolase
LTEEPTAARLQSRWDRTALGQVHSVEGRPSADNDATPVILVHGLVISSLYMRPTAERLAPFVRVLAPDLPGFGRSVRPSHVLNIGELASALADWLQVLGISRPVLVANSLGCQVIAELAARQGVSVAGAVLAGPTVDPRARAALRQIGRTVLDWPREKLSLTPRWATDFLRAGPRRAWRTLQHALDDRVEEKLPAMTMPTLVVRGSRDPIVPQAWAERACALLPHGRLRIIEGGPHASNFSSADEFAGIIREFIADVAAERAER